ncbi:hypothetical protein [Bacteroides caecicola]|nr:hypothetical protein [Bacteroides caecicola]
MTRSTFCVLYMGKRTYRKKANAVRLCADDLMSRERHSCRR